MHLQSATKKRPSVLWCFSLYVVRVRYVRAVWWASWAWSPVDKNPFLYIYPQDTGQFGRTNKHTDLKNRTFLYLKKCEIVVLRFNNICK